MNEEFRADDFETFLSDVFIKAAEKEFSAEAEENEIINKYIMSHKTDVKILKLIRRNGVSVVILNLKRAAVAILALCTLLFGLKFAAPEVYAKITNFAFSLYKEYIEIYFDNSNQKDYTVYDINDVRISNTIDGYTVTSSNISDTRKKYNYTDENVNRYIIDLFISDNPTVYFDNERGTLKEIEINGFVGTLWIGNNKEEGISAFVKKGNLSVCIYGDISEKELIEIVDGIK